MPLYTAELESLKKELAGIRQFNKFYGFSPKEYDYNHYKSVKYDLNLKLKSYLQYLIQEQERDLYVYSPVPCLHIDEENCYEFEEEFSEMLLRPESETVDSAAHFEENYFNGSKLELLLDRVKFKGFYDRPVSTDMKSLDNQVLLSLDKIFQVELERLQKTSKAVFNNITLMQKLVKTHNKIKAGKLQEAGSLMSRFYAENKQQVIVGYLYLEVLYAKATMGSQKSLSRAREVANNVCFLTDKSDEVLTSYYRYMYVCREFVHDKERALDLLREFVLVDADKVTSAESLLQRDGFFLKCLLLFFKFDPTLWNSYEVESMCNLVHSAIAGGLFYIYFMREKVLPLIDTTRYQKFLQVEQDLFNLYSSHQKTIGYLHNNFGKNALPKSAVETMNTISQKYVQTFLLTNKIPDFGEYITNTSLLGIQYLEHTQNDKIMQNNGMLEHSFWRSWVAKITFETSLQRADLLPFEYVVEENQLLAKYDALVKRAFEYEKEILYRDEYSSVKEMLADVRTDAIASVIMGENRYNPFAYGFVLDGMKDYYSGMKMVHSISNSSVSGLIMDKGEYGLFWNLEEIQLMLESLNLTIDHKTLGLKARLDKLLNSTHESLDSDEQYMSLSEHISLYWWAYVLLISLMILMFNMLSS